MDTSILVLEINGEILSFNFPDNVQLAGYQRGFLTTLWAINKTVYKAQGVIGDIIAGTALVFTIVQKGVGDDICGKIGSKRIGKR